MNTFGYRLFSHPLLKNSAIVFAGSMGANVAGWLYHLFVGRILGTEGYGELAALLSLFYILNVPSAVIQTVLVKFFSLFKTLGASGQEKKLLRIATAKILIFEGIGLAVIVIVSSWVSSAFHISSSWNITWIYLIFATYLISIVNMSAMQGHQLFVAASALGVFGMVLRFFFGVVFAFFGVGWTLIGNIISNLVSYAISFIPIRFLTKAVEQPMSITRKDAFGFSVPTLITTLGITLLFSQDVLVVKRYFTGHEAGIYASLSVLGKVLFYATSAVSFVLFPVISERSIRNHNHRRLVGAGLLFIGAICAGLTAVYFLTPGIVIFAFGKAFQEAGAYMGLFAVFISFFSLSNILVQTLLAMNRVKVWIIITVAAVVQVAGLFLIHDTIVRVITVNIVVSAGLFLALLLYYGHESRPSAISVSNHPSL